jgi:hypothetical protein
VFSHPSCTAPRCSFPTLESTLTHHSGTFAGAPSEIQDYLTNLRQTLYEERAHLRKARKHQRRRRSSFQGGKNGSSTREKEDNVGPEAALQAMQTALKHLTSNFRRWERPFLRDPTSPSSRRRKKWADEFGYSSGGPGEEDGSDYYNCENRYKPCGLRCVIPSPSPAHIELF